MKGTAMKTLRPILLTFIVAFALVTRAGAVGYWGRMYDPNLQRWIQRDPIGERGDINLYRFVANGPVNFMDPYGLSSVIITDTSGHVTILDNPSNAALRNAIASFASGSIDDVSIAGHGSHDFMALGKGSGANGIFLDPTTNQVEYDD